MKPSMVDYLSALYPPGTPGELLAYVKEPFSRRFGTPAKLVELARQIEHLDRQGLDLYLTINTLDGRAVRKRGPFARGLETEVAAVVALVADVDAAGKPGHDYPTQRQIIDALAAMPLPPSIIVISGRREGGLHVYWLLAVPFIIRGDGDRERIKRASREWQRLLKAKLAPHELDSTFDLVRVLRPIGTTNKKYGSTVSALVFQPDRRFNLQDLEGHLPRPEPVRWTAPATPTGSSVIDRAGKYVVTIPGAISGQGGHNITFHVACVLVEGFGLSVADALPIMRGWNTTCQPPWDDAQLRHKLESADARAEKRGYLLTNDDHQPCGAPMVNRLVLVGA